MPTAGHGHKLLPVLGEGHGTARHGERVCKALDCTLGSQCVPFTGVAGRYLEVFARRHNLRSQWVSIGNEVLGSLVPFGEAAGGAAGVQAAAAGLARPQQKRKGL